VSAPIWSDTVVPDVSRLSLPVSVLSMSGFDQTAGQSAGENHLYASAPTSMLSGFRCSRSGVFASLATLLLLAQFLVCCIHRLNSPGHSRLVCSERLRRLWPRSRRPRRFYDRPLTDLLRTPSNAFFPHRQWQYLTDFYLTEATCTFTVFQAKSEPLLSKAFGDFR